MNYTTGTITLANGSKTVIGTGTGWQTAVIAGGVIYPQAAGNPLPIASVDSNTQITAATAWVGASGTYSYALQRQDDARQTVANAAALADYIQRLYNPALSALATLTPSADMLPYFNGEGSSALSPLTAFSRGLLSGSDATEVLRTLGVSDFAKALFGDENSSAALSRLGVSNFVKTLLNDANASAARSTLGAQAALGFTPVRQGAGANQGTNNISIGWSDDGRSPAMLLLQVDSVNFDDRWRINIDGDARSVGGIIAGNIARRPGGANHIYAPSAYYFRSATTNGQIAMNTGHSVEFHWNNGFYYRINGNAWVLINASASDARFKDIVDDAGIAPEAVIAAVEPVRWQRKNDIPVHLPDGARLGFLAQDLQSIDPTLVREIPIPGADESAEQQTYLALAEDADIQLIAHLWRAVRKLSDRVAQLEAASLNEA